MHHGNVKSRTPTQAALELELFTPKQVAALTHIGEFTVRDAIKRMELRAIRIGNPDRPKRLLVPRDEVARWLQEMLQ